MNNRKYDFIIVGTGAGGATVARELARKGKRGLILDRGAPQEKIGTFMDSRKYFDVHKLTMMPPRSREGVILWRALMSGGTTVVSCGNGVRSLEKELGELGVQLETEFAETENEMQIMPYDERRLSSGSKRILEASRELGYRMEPMPKFIDPTKCRRCGACQLGCRYGAKWTTLDYLNEAREKGTEVRYRTRVSEVIIDNGKAKGLRVTGPGGGEELHAGVIILAAGGVGTPVILQMSGIEDAGSNFFMDLLVNTYGVSPDLTQVSEPTMALVDQEFHESKGFILSPFINQPRLVRFLEMGLKGIFLPTDRLLGIMTKIKDDPAGRVYPDGTFSKPVTAGDREKLNEGSSISREILARAGTDPKSIVVSNVQGAHPGGTAAIGRVVDKDLQTKIDSLFVCDASVLPVSPGLPPIVTIVALAKRLAKTLN